MARVRPLPVAAPYEPLPVPPAATGMGGLLATAVGTPESPLPPVPPQTMQATALAPLAPTNLAPASGALTPLLPPPTATPPAPAQFIDPNTYEHDDVVAELNKITSQDSDYMQLARTSGLQTANKRGLLNTSLAAGASQAAALAAAAPLASQNSAQAAQRNQLRVGAFFQDRQQDKDIFSREKMMNEQLRSEEMRLGRQLTSNEVMQMRDISTRLQMQGIDLNAQSQMQQRQIAATEKLTNLNIAAESERLGRTLTAQEQAQIRDLAAQQTRLTDQLTMQQQLTMQGYATDLQRTQLQLDSASALQASAITSQEQQAALNYYLGQDQIYAQSISNLYANAELPAPARNDAIQLFTGIKNNGVDMPAALFGASTTWGGTPSTMPAPPPVTIPIGTAPVTGSNTGTLTQAQIDAMQNDGIPGNYAAYQAAHPGP